MSELEEWMNRRLQSEARDSTQYRVTVRLGWDLHRKLVKLAAVCNMSKTAACEDIAAAAIKDAWAYYMASLDDAERAELLYDMDEEARQEELMDSAPPGFFQAALQKEDDSR